ncbi:ATP-binding cassette domain-containing protein [Actinomadura madurae]|uniref:ATP-binding cassette domain-containing protein n=1 Tax=Actinomadura madurae TaxID=1993 RepID=UPI001C677243|nr:ATP-binding cassette domain-containing protein [Actinomadura madurae]
MSAPGIVVTGLRKRYGATLALDGMSFTVRPGVVTGFVGPNGAGKSTTMRVILGLDAVEEGTALIEGKPYHSLRRPLNHVGSLLDAAALHPGRSGRNHLLWLAHSQGLAARRVDQVIEQVGLASAARRKAGGYSLGMRQRLGIAAALLGDPPIIMLDEPFNGMDPDGIVWMRGFLRSLAAQGRAVLVSSHLMSEVQSSGGRRWPGSGAALAAASTGPARGRPSAVGTSASRSRSSPTARSPRSLAGPATPAGSSRSRGRRPAAGRGRRASARPADGRPVPR